MAYKLGSLFDGSGGFPLAGSLCGIQPVWAAEVEPYPIAVTRSRFPSMRHLGDISKVKGSEIEPVDIITFGSPCQDLSVAGKQAGIKHTDSGDEETTRSGLFMEAVRIIKEMREATYGLYPRFALWENVPGAFASNKGEDFRTVLTELIRIVEPDAVMPAVPKAGWVYADSYVGDGWSLAYRLFDAQYWGVPQRRRRIHLVLDLRGERAREVLFEREGVQGYFEPCRAPREGASSDTQGCSGADDRTGIINLNKGDVQSKAILSPDGIAPALYAGECRGGGGECYVLDESPIAFAQNQRDEVRDLGDKAGALQAEPGMKQQTFVAVPWSPVILDSCGGQGERAWQGETAPTLKATHYKTPPIVTQTAGFCTEHSADARGIGYQEEVSPTLRAGVTPATVYCLQGNGIDRALTAGCNGKGWRENECYTLNTIDRPAVAYAMQAFGQYKESEVASSLKQRDYKDATDLVCGVDCRNATEYPELNGTLQAKSNGGFSYNCNQVVRVQYIVRRLTPTECARLQGFPDLWGHPDQKDRFTPDEYRFWLNVRNTHASINGRAVKHYTEAQMLAWYNKLHTDSSEYKMWGNGIALPPALYCMQGMMAVLSTREELDAWLY